MNTITVSDKEAEFDSEELFFSITKRDSTILSGNDVFMRISGYAKEELLGSYHNIIRHPDMPKIVFKTLWDALKADRPLVAYVKNRSKDGRFYWVLAAVFPLGEHFVSIRIKPDSSLFATVRELYARLLMAEATGGMESSAPLMDRLLQDYGFENYERFMSDALLMELGNRKARHAGRFERTILFDTDCPSLIRLDTLRDTCQNLVKEYDVWFEKIYFFREMKSIFEEKATLLRRLARDVVFLSLNASVSSYKVENGGETFGVLARDIRSNAKENDELIGSFHGVITALADGLDELIFSVSAVSLQIETVTYFIEEVLCKNNDDHIEQVNENIADLLRLVDEYAHRSHATQAMILRQCSQMQSCLERLEKQMFYLGYIQVYGVIEAAREDAEAVRFGVIFSELKTLLEQTTREIETMQKMGGDFERQSRNLLEKSIVLEKILERLDRESALLTKGTEF